MPNTRKLTKPLMALKSTYSGEQKPKHSEFIHIKQKTKCGHDFTYEHIAYLSVGARFGWSNKEPLENDELPEQIMQLIAHELYGDLRDELIKARYLAFRAKASGFSKGQELEEILEAILSKITP